MNIGYLFYLATHFMLVVLAAQAIVHYYIWTGRLQWDDPINRPLKIIAAAVVCAALAIVWWVMNLLFSGAIPHRVLSPTNSLVANGGLYVSFWLFVIASWMIDFKMSAWRVVRCIAAQTIGSIFAAFCAHAWWGW